MPMKYSRYDSKGGLIRRAASCAVAAVALIHPSVARSQASGSILIISQRAEGTDKNTYIDLSPHLEPALREAGKYEAVVFRADMPAIRELVTSKVLDESDLKIPLSKATAHKLAKGLGVRYILTISANSTKDGIVASADTETAIGLDQWSTLSTEKIFPARMKGKQLSLLESVHVVIAGLVEKVDSAISHGPRQSGPKAGVPQVSDTPSHNVDKTSKGRQAASNPPARASESSKGNSTSANSGLAQPNRGGPAGAATGPSISASTVGIQTPVKPQNIPSTYDLLIEKARRNGDVANLLIALRRAVTEKPHDIRLRRDLVKAYNDRGWHDMAREEALRAVVLAPDDASLHRLLGDALLETSEPETALKEYQLAVHLAPRDSANFIALGDAYWNAAKPDESLKAYEDAAKAEPKSPAPARRLARLYGLRGKYTECIAAINAARNLTPTDDMSSFREDHAALLSSIESSLSQILARIQTAKKLLANGTRNREETYKEVTSQRKKAEELVAFLDAMPDVGFSRVQALFMQAATLVSQTAEKSLDYLETENSAQDEEASLLRIEASKQLGDASKTLKAQLAAKK